MDKVKNDPSKYVRRSDLASHGAAASKASMPKALSAVQKKALRNRLAQSPANQGVYINFSAVLKK
jgi:hypothetical protein